MTPYWTDPTSLLKTFTKLSCVCEWHQSWKIKSIFVLYDCNCAHRLDIFSSKIPYRHRVEQCQINFSEPLVLVDRQQAGTYHPHTRDIWLKQGNCSQTAPTALSSDQSCLFMAQEVLSSSALMTWIATRSDNVTMTTKFPTSLNPLNPHSSPVIICIIVNDGRSK